MKKKPKARPCPEALATLADDARALWEEGTLRNEQRLRRAFNLARRRLPEHEATRALGRLVASLRDAPPR